MISIPASGTPVGILLAAGRGMRFDPSGRRNKLQQACGAGTVVTESARKLLAVLDDVVAAVRADDPDTAASLRTAGCRVVLVDAAEQGMSVSLRAALSIAPQASGWIIALGDMPFVQPGTIQALRDALVDGAGIAAPSYMGRRGNPVAFSRVHLPALLQLRGDQGARSLLAAHDIAMIPVEDPGILQDIDTTADLGTLSNQMQT